MIMNGEIIIYNYNYVQMGKRRYVKWVRRFKVPQKPTKQIEIDGVLFPATVLNK